MQNYTKHDISAEEVIIIAAKMKTEGRQLVMIHGFVDKDGQNVISYDYEIGQGIESYTVTGSAQLPSISAIYDTAASWPERELHELMSIDFANLDTSERLFLPDNMLSGQGNIIVTPLAELRENNNL